jgi:hypothetical protein
MNYSRKSGQFYNYTDNHAKTYNHLLAKKTQKAHRATKKNRSNHFERLSNREIQEMWQSKLSMPGGGRTWTTLLSFCQPAWNKTYHGLCLYGVQASSRKIIKKLSRRAKNYGRDQQYQSRVNSEKKLVIGNKYWHLKWIRIKPP